MIRRLTIILALTTISGITEISASNTSVTTPEDYFTLCEMTYDGHYSKTSHSVTIYTEAGHCKGTYAIYLHNGDRYIRFFNNWICIQGKHRFFYSGNWYVIR